MNLGENIRTIRESKDLTQQIFVEKFNELTGFDLKRTTVSSWETGKSRPSTDELPVIAKILHTTVGALFGEAVDVRPAVRSDVRTEAEYKIEKYKSQTSEPESMRVLIQTVDNKGRHNILFVPIKAQAGYLIGASQHEYVSNLPTFFLPGLNNGTFRAFEVAGYSMLVEKGVGFSPGDVVIGEFVENPQEIRDGQVYIVVNNSQEADNIVLKRCLNRLDKDGGGVIWCKSDNRDYPMFPLTSQQIKEVWRFKRKISAQAPDPSGIFERLNEHDAQIAQLKMELKKIEKT